TNSASLGSSGERGPMSLTKGRGTEVSEPVPVTMEPDGVDDEAVAEPPEHDHTDQLARWRRSLRRVPVWAAVEVAVVVTALLVGLVTRSGGVVVPATSSAQQLVTVTRGTLSTTVSAQGTVAAAN